MKNFKKLFFFSSFPCFVFVIKLNNLITFPKMRRIHNILIIDFSKSIIIAYFCLFYTSLLKGERRILNIIIWFSICKTCYERKILLSINLSLHCHHNAKIWKNVIILFLFLDLSLYEFPNNVNNLTWCIVPLRYCFPWFVTILFLLNIILFLKYNIYFNDIRFFWLFKCWFFSKILYQLTISNNKLKKKAKKRTKIKSQKKNKIK